MSFQNTTAVATGLSDFHKMIVTVCKNSFPKSKSKEIIYRNYKNFDKDAFQCELKVKLQSINNYESFESVFLSVLNKHAPLKKKFLRGNPAPYMTKQLRKAIMRRSELEIKYLKNRIVDNKTKFKKIKAIAVNFIRKNEENFILI